ncbi:flagellar hook-associated protein 2 [Alkalihalobacillus sp. BA299]|uniref:flagellar hook-associated protein 2 n=1 Tax=Alkalihalobacillus sp. BA299 TaxID=2815938 RepID=UPI001ADC8642|nr:flagellar hook-associated protein 2 [Alkalihalobacillus sp. BA299]
MRIGGLASGIDTESIIRDLMKVERQPLDRFFQKKQTIEWQRDAYRNMNLKLKALEESAYSLRLTSAFNTREAKSSNEAAFTVTANSSVQNGTYNFEVKQVATKTRNISTASISSADAKVSATKAMNEQETALGDLTAYNGTTFSITTHNSNDQAVTREFTVDTSKSLNQLFKEINDSDLGVRAYYDSTYDKVVIERKETGEFAGIDDGTGVRQIYFDGDTSFLNDVLNIDQANETAGQNAQVTFEDPTFGETIEETSRSNRITIGGLSFNVMQTTGPETVTVSSNTDNAFDNIKAFVDKYNETIAEIQLKTSEPTYRDFPPLTDEQRREMSEREAELWDEKAKSGLLRRDPILSSVLTQMRNDLYSNVQTTGEFSHLTEIGIDTTSNYRDGGRLEIDETKLRQALEDDPNSVYQLFNNEGGLVPKIRTTINDSMKKVTSRAGNENRTNHQFTLGRELIDVDQQIDRFQRRLADIENRYWSQFTRMEQAVNQANAQGASLMQFMGGA